MNFFLFTASLLIICVLITLARSFKSNQKGYVLIRSCLGGYKVSTTVMFALPLVGLADEQGGTVTKSTDGLDRLKQYEDNLIKQTQKNKGKWCQEACALETDIDDVADTIDDVHTGFENMKIYTSEELYEAASKNS